MNAPLIVASALCLLGLYSMWGGDVNALRLFDPKVYDLSTL